MAAILQKLLQLLGFLRNGKRLKQGESVSPEKKQGLQLLLLEWDPTVVHGIQEVDTPELPVEVRHVVQPPTIPRDPCHRKALPLARYRLALRRGCCLIRVALRQGRNLIGLTLHRGQSHIGVTLHGGQYLICTPFRRVGCLIKRYLARYLPAIGKCLLRDIVSMAFWLGILSVVFKISLNHLSEYIGETMQEIADNEEVQGIIEDFVNSEEVQGLLEIFSIEETERQLEPEEVQEEPLQESTWNDWNGFEVFEM